MISKLLGYIDGLTAVAALFLGAWVFLQSLHIEDLREDLEAARASLSACEARQADITEHKERTNEIDALPLDDLRSRANEWLLDF
jgi:hypothetical protein